MKYRDLITIFVSIIFLSSLGYAAGVAKSLVVWIVPAALFILLVLIYYYLWKK